MGTDNELGHVGSIHAQRKSLNFSHIEKGSKSRKVNKHRLFLRLCDIAQNNYR
jgi:hypothetical protein